MFARAWYCAERRILERFFSSIIKYLHAPFVDTASYQGTGDKSTRRRIRSGRKALRARRFGYGLGTISYHPQPLTFNVGRTVLNQKITSQTKMSLIFISCSVRHSAEDIDLSKDERVVSQKS